MTLVTQAVIFAAQAHDGAARKGSEIPYIVHPMEVVAIASTMTDDPQVLAAAALHDVMEDCGIGFDELSRRFGVRVAGLVCQESQQYSGDPCQTWNRRKLGAVRRICAGCRATPERNMLPSCSLNSAAVKPKPLILYLVIGFALRSNALDALISSPMA